MTSDPFDQLRISDTAGQPDPRFVAGLRNRLVAALEATTAPAIDLPERSPVVTDTTTTHTSTADTATATLKPYLCVSPAVEAVTWYVEVLGATELLRYTGDDGRIGHAELAIGGASFMLSDPYPDQGVPVVDPTTLGGTPFSMQLSVPDVDAVFERVAAAGDALVARPPHDEPYGARTFDMVDPFGHRWMIQTPNAQPTVEEVEAGMEGYSISDPGGVMGPREAAAPTPVEIGYATFSAPDTARAVRFYGALFGWVTEAGTQGDEYAHVANTRLPMGITPGGADDPPVLYYRVDDVAAYAAKVRELGGEVLVETTYASGPSATCRDDQGRQFLLWQPAPGYE